MRVPSNYVANNTRCLKILYREGIKMLNILLGHSIPVLLVVGFVLAIARLAPGTR